MSINAMFGRVVYEPGQFFVAHQDSEKADDMIGTLVATLPSEFTGQPELAAHANPGAVGAFGSNSVDRSR